MNTEIKINLQDTQWKFDYVDHDRNIARAVVYDESGQFYFVRAERDDDFGKATLIETAGGGVEEGEDLLTAVRRENNYFLCRVESFGDKKLTEDEIKSFHLSTLKLSYEEAVKEYEYRSNTRLGKLVANRELPVLHRAKEILGR